MDVSGHRVDPRFRAFSMFHIMGERQHLRPGIRLSRQQILAVCAYLSQSVPQCYPAVVSEAVLETLVRYDSSR